jgi:esterase/lipase
MRNKIIISALLMILLVASLVMSHHDYIIKVDDGTLYGTLNHQSYERLAIFISGSGPTDRDGNSDYSLTGRNDALKELAKALNNEGVSTFAYDKRTSGKSVDTFNLSDITFQKFVDDANAVLNGMNQLGYKEIYLIGHSQGALVSEIVGQDSRVAGVVSLCGTVNVIDQTLLEQLKRQSDVETYEQSVQIINKIRQEDYDFEVIEPLEDIFGKDINNRFLYSWMAYKPMDYIQPIADKLLFIYGDRDMQVSTNESVKLNDEYRYTIIKNMNHVLKTVENDHENLDSYSNPIYKINADLVDIILAFIL